MNHQAPVAVAADAFLHTGKAQKGCQVSFRKAKTRGSAMWASCRTRRICSAYLSCTGAAAAGLSTSMLNRIFRRYLHRSALDYLRELRLNRIRYLLAESDLTLTEIAGQTGYGSKIALSAAFRAGDGMSPGVYRQKTRRQSEHGKYLLE